ncbi:MAG: hypothetical protein OXU20_09145 [Myxococcales bacterium]|nr:hypothetical protein [Myxococcales bacterium]MDD9968057.1 hypothetical protein [Myxococcales bacterium]
MSPARSRLAVRCQTALIVLGALNLLGFLSGQGWLRGLAIASVASPLPFVFSQFRDYETFAADYELTAYDREGREERVAITPRLYSKLGGTYNRRNTYGAAASYGPRMTRPAEQALVTQVLTYGLCHGGPIAQQLDNPKIARATLQVTSRTAGSDETWSKTVECDDDAR